MAKSMQATHSSSDTNGQLTLTIHVVKEVFCDTGTTTENVENVTFDVRDECGETTIDPAPTYSMKKSGVYEITLPQAGVYFVIPLLPDDEVGLYTPLGQGFLVCVDKSRSCPIPVPCFSLPSEVRASACVVNHDDTKQAPPANAASPATDPVRVPNVTYSLYRGASVAGAVLDTFTATQSCQQAIFSDLRPGFHTMMAEVPSGSNYKPCCATKTFYLSEGQSVDLGCCFCFEAVTSDVTATVTGDCGSPMTGVRMQLVGGPQRQCHDATSGDGGLCTFPSVAPGNYLLQLQGNVFRDGSGAKWQPVANAVQVQVGPPSSATPAPVFILQRDILRIDIAVNDPNGNRQANAVVEIYDETKTRVVATVVLDENGKYSWVAPHDKPYYFALKPTPGGPPAQLFAATD